ncbi:hypothetical protein [Bradyrhizobium sp. SYSU BS000235]|uniref:hypothetical protein n=1 Tax=Bradyrhizobium sp. SYSU BS000235 TaxID=3411332 RepID=UPI003C727B88
MSARLAEYLRSVQCTLPLWIGLVIYIVLLAGGNWLLTDPDTFWQIRVGQRIVEHRALPVADMFSLTMRGQPWISTQWLAQVLYGEVYALWGWAGPVALASLSIAAAFALLAGFLQRHLGTVPVVILTAAALAVAWPHLHARPHVLALPVMVAWVGSLLASAERGSGLSLWLVALMTLWANLHGSFVFGLALIVPVACDALINADRGARGKCIRQWSIFAVAALGASMVTPYGWNSLLAARAILNLGNALSLISEWQPVDFGHPGPIEWATLAAFALVLLAGVKFPPMRVLLFVALLFMALSHRRNADVFALVSPLVIATPLALRFKWLSSLPSGRSPHHTIHVLSVAMLAAVITIGASSLRTYKPDAGIMPEAAVAALKQAGVTRVFNHYGFGGYMIFAGLPPFIDGRTELYGEAFVLQHAAAQMLRRPADLFSLLDRYNIEATLFNRSTPAALLLDHVDGWQKLFIDDRVVVHIRDRAAVHSVDPDIKPLED